MPPVSAREWDVENAGSGHAPLMPLICNYWKPLRLGAGERLNTGRWRLGTQRSGVYNVSDVGLPMSFSFSTFTIEINAVPTVAFQAKWQADADQICRDWLHTHWDQLSAKGPGGIDLPPIFKLRLARASEREAYEAERTGFEFCGEVKLVNLIEVVHPHETDDAHPANGSERNGAEDFRAVGEGGDG